MGEFLVWKRLGVFAGADFGTGGMEVLGGGLLDEKSEGPSWRVL